MKRPILPLDHEQRLDECRVIMGNEFELLIQAIAHGWEPKEATIALAEIALKQIIRSSTKKHREPMSSSSDGGARVRRLSSSLHATCTIYCFYRRCKLQRIKDGPPPRALQIDTTYFDKPYYLSPDKMDRDAFLLCGYPVPIGSHHPANCLTRCWTRSKMSWLALNTPLTVTG
jgi:hypothetical protein